jgi:hypothetical protein
MMTISLTVFAENAATEAQLATELKEASRELVELVILRAPDLGQLIVVDEGYPGLEKFLDELDEAGHRRGRAVYLVVSDRGEAPPSLLSGRVDDVLVRPFRSLDVLSKTRHSQQILMWDEVDEINASFSEMIDQLRGDLKLAERLQKSKLPLRFPDLRGFKVAHRYIAGLKAGGDHFDVAESKDGHQLSLVLSDSSSYGLSSAVLSTLMRVMMRLSSEESRSCAETVRRIQDELKATLNEKDRLSLFYGIVSRKDYRLRFVNLGTSSAFYAPPGKDFQELPVEGAGIQSNAFMESEVMLSPLGRLALISDGFMDAAGGPEAITELLNGFRAREGIDLVNELVFRVKKQLVEENDLPAQDCTAVIFDLDERLIRLAKN